MLTNGVDVNPRKEPRHRLEYVPSLFHEYAKTLFGGELPLQENRRIHDRQIGLNCRQSGFGDGLPGHLDFTSFLATILARMSASSCGEYSSARSTASGAASIFTVPLNFPECSRRSR